jgi:hypothetical protein
MKKDRLYENLVTKMHEVAIVPPQQLGVFTPIYKKSVSFLKISPWKTVFVFSAISAFILYLLFGQTLVRLVSVLQIGF